MSRICKVVFKSLAILTLFAGLIFADKNKVYANNPNAPFGDENTPFLVIGDTYLGDGTQDASDVGWSYVANTKTITLYNCNYSSTSDDFFIYANYYTDTLNIVLIGESTISGISQGISFYSPTEGTLNISGPGSLTLSVSNVGIVAGSYNGSSTDVDIIIDNCSVVTGEVHCTGDVSIDDSTVECNGFSYPLFADSISVNNSSVKAFTSHFDSNTAAIYGNVVVGENSTVIAHCNGSGNDCYGINGIVTINSDTNSIIAYGNTYAVFYAKNGIKGTGWTDIDGKEGAETIPINTSGQYLSSYKRVCFPMATPTVTQAPTGKNLTYNGASQELVNAGSVNGGIMNYALGSSETVAPSDSSFNESIPTGNDVGDYFVWYKGVGTGAYAGNTEAKCVKVSIFPQRATISFDANGGGGTMQEVIVDKDASYKLPQCSFTAPKGKIFDKWDKGTIGTSLTISSNIVIKAIWKSIEYDITVLNDGNGNASASITKGIVGTEVLLTSTPNDGFKFKYWQVLAGDIEIADNKFLIGYSNVSIKAIFEKVDPSSSEDGTKSDEEKTKETDSESEEKSESKSETDDSETDLEVEVTGVKLNKKSICIAVGQIMTLNATILPENATNADITWKSSNKKIATVDEDGKVKGIKKGTATITVVTDDGGKEASCKVTVKDPIKVEKVKFSKKTYKVKKGKTITLKLIFKPKNATNKDVTYKSSNKKIAKVDKNGKVSGIKRGTVTITAISRDGKKKAKCKVKVK